VIFVRRIVVMKATKLPAFVFAIALIAVPASQFAFAAPAPAPQADSGNLYREVMDHKGTQWKTAPDTAIPNDVCTMFQACAGPARAAVLTLTEGGQKVQRGLFLSPTGTKGQDAMILYRQTAGDRYFFLVGSDGSLQKAAYVGIGGNSWILMANSLAQPTFAKDKQAWHTWVSKPAPAPAAPKPAAGDSQ
jgi:hypothetical protein